MAKHVDAMIVGASKSGTTSLLRYLAVHPRVHAPANAEFTAFDPRISADCRRGELAEFLRGSLDRLTLAKHAGAYHTPAEIDLILQHNPACRLLLILRDPVQRAYSVFRMASLRGETQETFSEAIDEALTREARGDTEDYRVRRYLNGGRYADWCSGLLARCDREQIAVLLLELFQRDPGDHYRRLCEWLGLESGRVPGFSPQENVGAEPRSAWIARGLERLRSEQNPAKRTVKRTLPDAVYRRTSSLIRSANRRMGEAEPLDGVTEKRLRGYFAEPNARLAQLLGLDFEWSSSAAGGIALGSEGIRELARGGVFRLPR